MRILVRVVGEPVCASFGEGAVDFSFIKGEVFESGLVVDWPSVHGASELHDAEAEVLVAGEDGGFDGGGATVCWEQGRMEIENSFGLAKSSRKSGLINTQKEASIPKGR